MEETTLEKIQRHLQEQTTADENASLQSWRQEHADNEALFQEQARLHEYMTPDEPQPAFDVDAGWAALSQRLAEEEGAEVVSFDTQAKKRSRFRRPFGFMMIAAAAALAFFFLPRQQLDPERMRLEVPEGQRQTAVLPDGSKVDLSGGSILVWSTDSPNNMREVTLSGQGFFDVVPDKKRLFVVNTYSAKVRVLGTSFDVWTRNEETRVVVSEGIVSLARHDDINGVRLIANQMSSVRPGEQPGPAEAVDAAALTGWRQGKIVFKNQALLAVTLDLTGIFGQKVRLHESVDPEQRFSASYDGEPLETILEELCLTLELSWEKTDDGYLIRPKQE